MNSHIQTLDEASAKAYLDEWKRFFKLVGLPVRSLEGIKIPPKNSDQRNFTRLIIMHGNMFYRQLADICKFNFNISFPYENMEKITKSREERFPVLRSGFPVFKSAMWVEDYQEVSMKNNRKSWNDLLREENIGINLRERIIFHLRYYLETGKYLDAQKTATLCSVTTFPDSNVPYVYFDLASTTLVVKQCKKDFLGKIKISSDGKKQKDEYRNVISRSVVEFDQ